MSTSEQVTRNPAGSTFLRRLFKSRSTRRALISTTTISASASASLPTDSTATSAGASRNAAELSKHLDKVLVEVGNDGLLGVEEDNLADRLWEATERFANCSLPRQLEEWKCSADEAELIKLAAWASDAAYHDSIDPEDPNTNAQHLTLFKRIAAHRSGNFKAVTLWHTSGGQPNSGTIGFVAIRGSALLIDWLVNTDGDADEVNQDFLPLSSDEAPPYRAHRGLCRVAQRMARDIKVEIKNLLNEIAASSSSAAHPVDPDLVLTGHSAGGGVIALIFAHLLLSNADICKKFRRIHCITFGAPPVFSPPTLNECLESLLLRRGDLKVANGEVGMGGGGLFASIVNQGDPVTRADKMYIRSLTELYAKRGLAQGVGVEAEKPVWALPDAELCNAGKVIVAHDANPDEEETDWKFSVVGREVMEGLVWGNVKVHKMGEYVRAVNMICRNGPEESQNA